MVFHWRLTQTVEISSPLDFGKVSKMLWGLVSPLAPPATLNQLVKYNASTKFWKICSELLLFHSEWIGRNAFQLSNLLITIAINLACVKLLLKFYMDEGVERLLTGQKPGKDNSLARI